MKRELTCIICPRGCVLTVELNSDNNVLSVSGNTCKRGEIYAQNECTNPQRTVTTTMRRADGKIVPVKTDRTIPKDKVAECMRMINQTNIDQPTEIGDIVMKDVFGSNVVVTSDI